MLAELDLSELAPRDPTLDQECSRLGAVLGANVAAYLRAARGRPRGLCSYYQVMTLTPPQAAELAIAERRFPSAVFVAYRKPLERRRQDVSGQVDPQASGARPRVLVAWSSGKDSAWALHTLVTRAQVEVVGLLTTLDSRHGRVSMHGVGAELLRAQASAAGLPLVEVSLPDPCSDAEYALAMGACLERAKAAGVTAVAFGDLFLETVRRYREERLAPTGIAPLFPLWGRDPRELALEMITGGLKAKLACVDVNRLGPGWVGREYDRTLLAELPASVDSCGENGEFHTFVYDGPMFSEALRVRLGSPVARDGFAFAEIVRE